MSAGAYFSIGAVALFVVALLCTTRKYKVGAAAAMSDSDLIKHGRWDECDGEPMNVWAEEFDRRNDRAAAKGAGGQNG